MVGKKIDKSNRTIVEIKLSNNGSVWIQSYLYVNEFSIFFNVLIDIHEYANYAL